MFDFLKTTINELDINEAYITSTKDDSFVIVCVDEYKLYEPVHVAGSENLPVRLCDQFETYFPDKELTYGLYSSNYEKAKQAYKKVIKLGYKNVYALSSFIGYTEDEEGYNAKKNRKQRRNKRQSK